LEEGARQRLRDWDEGGRSEGARQSGGVDVREASRSGG